jgi:TPR repeat protein
MRRLILLVTMLCLSELAGAAESAPSQLEQLFEAGRYPEFFSKARHLAGEGDADALFLLGKAYDLGKGVEPDADQAFDFYGQAAEQNNPRAWNNLGVIIQKRDTDHRRALEYFERAQSLGLQSVALGNARGARLALCQREQDDAMCESAGDAYVHAWHTERDNRMLDAAVVAYSTLCRNTRYINSFTSTKYGTEPPEVCEKATALAEKGAALGLPRATFNRGALAHVKGRYEEALQWYRLAHERGLGLAGYAIGKMYEEGRGVAKSDTEALAWFMRAAELKDERAIVRVSDHWEGEIRRTFDPALIHAAIAELTKIQPEGGRSAEGLYRLALLDTLKRNAETFPVLSKKAVSRNFCPRPRNVDFYGSTQWRIIAVTRAEDASDFSDTMTRLATGTADAKGCIALTPAARVKIRDALARGQTPLLNWPGQRHLLTLEPDANGVMSFDLSTAIR